jgi:4-hydroxy-tetrahydrodipicolinate synthase
MQDAWQEGRVKDAMEIQNRLVPLHDALFSETSPAPVKFGASLLGKTSEHCRLPLAPIMEATRAKVRAAMTEVGLLN